MRRTRKWYGFGGERVPQMSMTEIEATYAERAAERQRRDAEQPAELERARHEAQLAELESQFPRPPAPEMPQTAADIWDTKF